MLKDQPPNNKAYLKMLENLSALQSYAQQLESWRSYMRERKGYSQFTKKNEQHFDSHEEFCQTQPPFGLGCSASKIDQIIELMRS
ncbi:MAG: hypothetical protein AB4352_21165 [Hormoscilla sp.]